MTWNELKKNPPALTVNSDSKKVMFTMIGVMCDSKSYITFEKNSEGYFGMRACGTTGYGYSLYNYQFEPPVPEIIWAADEGDWDEVIKMLNSGVALIETVRSF